MTSVERAHPPKETHTHRFRGWRRCTAQIYDIHTIIAHNPATRCAWKQSKHSLCLVLFFELVCIKI